MNMVSPWTSRDTLERNVPLIRLEDDADLRVWILQSSVGPPLKISRTLTGDL